MSQRKTSPKRTAKTGQAATAAALLLLALGAPQTLGDDRELLKKNTAEPYVFFLLDSSRSMSLSLDGKWVEGGADDPRSRLYQAREVVYELLKSLPDNLRYGFATFGQDQLHVNYKHWLYYPEDPAKNSDNLVPLGDLQAILGYPSYEPGNVTEVPILDSDGEPTGDTEVDIDGDLMTFGKTFDSAGEPAATEPGSCADPLDLGVADERIMVNRYSKLGVDGVTTTKIYVQADVSGSPTVYRLTFDNANSSVLGSPTIDVQVTAEKLIDCVDATTGGPTFEPNPVVATIAFRNWLDGGFLLQDDGSGLAITEKSGGGGSGSGSVEPEQSGGLWGAVQNLQDALAGSSCGSDKPFSGGGWEGNYDTGDPFTSNPTFEGTVIPASDKDKVDTYCFANPKTSANCDLLLFPTKYDTDTVNPPPNPPPNGAREVDSGDLLPFHWDSRNKDEFLSRLNPDHGNGGKHYGAAYYFEDAPVAAGEPLRLKSTYRGTGPNDPDRVIPVIAAGTSPVSDAILDFRCWYSSDDGDNSNGSKCGRGGLENVYTRGFLPLLLNQDQSAFDCRQPYLIVISDLVSNCAGEAKVADVAGMNNGTRDNQEPRSTGVSTWVFNVGTGNVTGLTNAGKGEEIKVQSKQQFRDKLRDVLGIIQESARAFASAAVPSVQADIDQQIYVTEFTPRQESSVWEGHVHAFKKPLPTTAVVPGDPTAGVRPDTGHENHLWDGAFILSRFQAPKRSDLSIPLDRNELRIGATTTTRRLYYPVGDTNLTTDSDGDGYFDNDTDNKVPRAKNLFGPAEGSVPSGMNDLNDVRKDLWLGMQIENVDRTFNFASNPDGSDLFTVHNTEATEAHRVFAFTYAIKEVTPRDADGFVIIGADPAEYVLGDVFHATPLLVGNPNNSRYLARSDTGEDFEGYQDFFEVQSRRRKVLFVASDDGELHAFDAARFKGTVEDGEFDIDDPDLGREIFAFTPRALLPTLKELALGPDHQWGIDGTPVAADVKIDPSHTGRGASSSDPPKDADRQWRTVVVGGLRRGGNSYYALDVTRPDQMVEEVKTIAGSPVSIGWKPADGTNVLPDCTNASGNPVANSGDCDPAGFNYPEILWEFTDDDLGDTWSIPDLGALRVIENGAEVIKYVAVFGGGMDPDSNLDENAVTKGDFLYIVDIETGKMLYKRHLRGATPGAPAAVDTNQDGILDRIYIGTTEGLMYRVNVDEPKALVTGASCPATPPVDSTDACCASPDGPDYGCVNDVAWEPFVLFDTETLEDSTDVDGNTIQVRVRKPIFFRPAVIFVARLNAFALAFGTGNRDNLWGAAPPGGNRFYLFSDDSDDPNLATSLPFFETPGFTDVTDLTGTCDDLLVDPPPGERGWFIKMGKVQSTTVIDEGTGETIDVRDEKVVTPATSVSGLTVFSTFVPTSETEDVGSGGSEERRCARRGVSRIYTQFSICGEPPIDEEPQCPPDDPDCVEPPPPPRNVDEVGTLVSEPFIEEATQPCPGTEGMAEMLMSQLFPPTCHFASYRWNLSAMRADTGVECLAQIPVCIVEKNWKDF